MRFQNFASRLWTGQFSSTIDFGPTFSPCSVTRRDLDCTAFHECRNRISQHVLPNLNRRDSLRT
jgi:hypothetical protein